MFKSTAGLPVSLEIKAGTNNSKIAELIDTPKGKLLVIAPKKSDPSQRFSGFGGANELEITIRATQAGNGSYHAAAPIERKIKIKKPTKDSFFSERRMDDRFETARNTFTSKMSSFKSITGEKAGIVRYDNYDSDGDGVSNLMERAFGGGFQ